MFFVTAIVFALVGCAWLLYYYLPGNDFTYFWGFFAMAVILVVLGVDRRPDRGQSRQTRRAAGADMAIEEARKIREDISAPVAGAGHAPGNGAAPVPAPEAATVPPAPAPAAPSAPPPEQEGER